MPVSIGSNEGSLRLRWTYQGKRYCLALGLQDTKTNRIKAQETILQIEADIETGNLDTSLVKYQPQKKLAAASLTCLQLFQRWLEFKSKFVDSRTIDWYRLTEAKLGEMGSAIANNITHSDAIQFLSKLQSQSLVPGTVKRHMENMRACWNWGIKRLLIRVNNPWDELVPLIRVSRSTTPRPFTKVEVRLIVDGFETLYPQLLPFVKFLFATGCRIGEARGLLWSCLSKDCSKCQINGQLSRLGHRKPTKTGEDRVLYLPALLQQMLLKMDRTNEYVFLWKEQPIGEDIFRHRWEKVLETVGVKYRKPYNTRATFISHALEQGSDPLTIAKQAGHNVTVLFTHYAGSLQNSPKLPELF